MCLGNAVFGGLIVYSQGMGRGLLAILLGNLLLFGYIGTLSWIGGQSGRNFSLQARRAFGDRGRAVVVGFLATVVIGWFSYQVGLTGTTLEDMYGWSPLWGGLVGGVFFGLLAGHGALVTGQPAVSVPAGWTDTGLPVGLQIIGRLANETVLRLAAAIESVAPWAHRRPEIATHAAASTVRR